MPLHKRPAHFEHLHLRRIQKPAARCQNTILLYHCHASLQISAITSCTTTYCLIMCVPQVSIPSVEMASCPLAVVDVPKCKGHNARCRSRAWIRVACLLETWSPIPLCFVMYQLIVLVSILLTKTEVPEYLLSNFFMSFVNWMQTSAPKIETMLRRFDLDPKLDAKTGSGAETGLDTGLHSKLDKGLDLDSTSRLRLRTVAQVCFVFTLHST